MQGRARVNEAPKQGQGGGIRKIITQGCDFRVLREMLIEYLSNFEDIIEELTEKLFDDGEHQILNWIELAITLQEKNSQEKYLIG